MDFDMGYTELYCRLGTHHLTPCTYCGHTTPVPPARAPILDTTSFLDGLRGRDRT